MITRIWDAWIPPVHAEAFETLLTKTVFPAIRTMNIDGLKSIELLRHDSPEACDFVVIFQFRDLASLRQMTGPDGVATFVPEAARRVVNSFESRARHFDSRFTSDAEMEIEHAG